MNHSNDFDRLVEQQDQELERDGVVSPVTRLRLEAWEQGHPLPPVGSSPAVQAATERLKRSLARLQKGSRFDGEEEGESCSTM